MVKVLNYEEDWQRREFHSKQKEVQKQRSKIKYGEENEKVG